MPTFCFHMRPAKPTTPTQEEPQGQTPEVAARIRAMMAAKVYPPGQDPASVRARLQAQAKDLLPWADLCGILKDVGTDEEWAEILEEERRNK
jgi:hypothetical protein